MMRKLFLFAGHGGKDPGATSGKHVESQLAIELRDLIIAELKKINVVASTDANENYLALTLRWLRGKIGERDVLIDIHWNASADPKANGTEVIVPEYATGYETSFGFAITRAMAEIGFKNRGVKPETQTARKKLAIMSVNAENILIEVCFISNASDMLLYEKSKHIIAKRLAYVIREHLYKQ